MLMKSQHGCSWNSHLDALFSARLAHTMLLLDNLMGLIFFILFHFIKSQMATLSPECGTLKQGSALRSLFCAHRYRMSLSSRGAFKSPIERGAGSAASDKGNRNARGHSWETLSLSTDPKTKAAGPESNAQTFRDLGLGLHREGT